MNIGILLYPGCDELDFVGPYEVLKTAATAGADFAVRFVSRAGPREITAAHGMRVWSEADLDENAPPDVIVVPGGGWNARAKAGTRAEGERGDLPKYLAGLYAGNATIASVCTGAMLLAAAGLLKGLAAITHHSAIDDLAAGGALVVRARVVDAGRIITSGGVTSGLDLALWITERFASPAIAHDVEMRLEYERRATVWRAPA